MLGETQMRELGMGALLGVGQGSARESQLVVMQWWGAGKPSAAMAPAAGEEAPEVDENGPLAFVGKGVTFDTGGISIKPSGGMEDMKWDMAGCRRGHRADARRWPPRGAKVNAVGVVGLVENMPSGTAQRPGDVVKSMSGQTIEVINTDAEGRLVLSDALWYCQAAIPAALHDRPRDADRAPSSLRSATSTPACSATTTRWPSGSSPPARRSGEPCGGCRWAKPTTS